ncbi:MAG: beta-N-acetylhexosaminidase [Xanthomonadales bacterium]|nr:beta-N-acetylhexosaminidase [Xanthomonadales bacterium]
MTQQFHIENTVLIGTEGPHLSERDRAHLAHPATGGVVLFTRNFQSPEQISKLVADMRDASDRELLITVDHEGGRVQRFQKGFTRLPALAVLGKIYVDYPERAVDLAYRHGRVMATELLLCGIDMSFAPVLDLDRESCVIGDRAFARDPAAVCALGGHYLAGMHDAGMKTCGKHFPGHGSVEADSHVADVCDKRPLADIESLDLRPFRELLPQLDSVMMAHVVYPAVDERPAGYADTWIRQHLRQGLNYRGVVFSDDLGMHAAAFAGTLFERMRLSLEAGCDAVLVCKPGDVEALYSALPATGQAVANPLAKLRGHNPHTEQELASVGEWRHWQQSLKNLEKSQWA